MFTFPAELAMEYFELGYPVIPTRGKIPTIQEWQRYADGQTRKDVEKLFHHHIGNAAIITGTVDASGLYSAVIDVDQMRLFNQWRERINTWTVGSYRGGHFHIKSQTPIVPFKCSEYEVRSAGQLITVPISRHRKGSNYLNLTDPATVANITYSTLDFLPVPIQFEREAVNKTNASYTRKPLTQFAHDVLLGRIDCAKYARMREAQGVAVYDDSRSALDMALMNSLASCGLDFDECAAAFANSKHYGKWHAMRDRADKYAPLKHNAERHANDYLLHTFNAAMKSRETQAARYALQIADAMELHISRRQWGGAAGLVDKATLRGVAQLMRKTRTTDLHIGRREMAELAQLAQQTATASLRRHVDASRLERTALPEVIKLQYGDGQILKVSTPARYAVNIATYANELGELSELGQGATMTERPITPPTREYFGVFEQPTRGGLGRMARSIFEALAQPLTQAQLCAKTGHSIRTIKGTLPLLIAHGLVSRAQDTHTPDREGFFMGCMAKSCTLTKPKLSKRGRAEGRRAGSGWLYVANSDANFQELGRKLGTLNVGAARKSQHERETIRYQERLQGAA